MIRLENVKRTYVRHGQTVIALQCDELRIAAGEYVAVIGPSGSGKTTLLSLLGGMLSPTAGRIWLDAWSVYEQSVAARSAIRRERMGFVFQTFNLIPYLTALQNVLMGLQVHGTADLSGQLAASRHMLKLLGLGDRMDYLPANLSGGQKQRVAVARALVGNPEVVFADEPTAALDSESGTVIVEMLKRLGQVRGTTTVMVTHDNRILELADRIVTLVDGRIVKDTAP